jgi:hypothetical protein
VFGKEWDNHITFLNSCTEYNCSWLAVKVNSDAATVHSKIYWKIRT